MNRTRTTLACLFPLLVVAAMLWAASCSHAQAVPVNTSFLNWRVPSASSVVLPPSPQRTLTLEILLPTWDAPCWLQVDQSSDLTHWQPLFTNAVQNVINPKVTMQINIGSEPMRLFRFGVRTNL